MSEAIEIEFVGACPLWSGREEGLARALEAAAAQEGRAGALAVLLTDDAAIAALNRAWRGKEGPTNVLSFPAAGAGAGFWGDIALAAETIAVEAQNQGKSFDAHAAHMAIHGFLHLLGYDHQTESEAEAMEARERAILAVLGIADPYAEDARS